MSSQSLAGKLVPHSRPDKAPARPAGTASASAAARKPAALSVTVDDPAKFTMAAQRNPGQSPAGGPARQPSGSPQAGSEQKPDVLMCILSYLGLFSLIPFFVKKDDPYISWHARQGVLLAIASFVIYAVLFVLSMLPGLGMILMPVVAVFGLGVLGLSIWCMIQACQGKRWPIPVLSQFTGKMPG